MIASSLSSPLAKSQNPKMYFSVEQTEALINAVRDSPTIYDQTCNEHKDIDLVNNAWKNVSEIVKADGELNPFTYGLHCKYANPAQVLLHDYRRLRPLAICN